jgi:hypothetical protein
MLGGSQTDADNFVTLAMVDTEVIAYETATLAGANTYTLGYLRRGGYGSANVAHSIGAPFVRLDDSIFRMPVDPSLIGSTVYLKFLSINAFGRTPRTLAEETAYTYVVGTNVELPDVPDVPASFAVLPVADGVSITWSNDNPQAVGCTSIEYATASGGPFTVLAQEGPTTTSFHHGFTSGATYYYRARARGPLPQSGWSAYTSELSSTGRLVDTAGLNVTLVNNPYFSTGDLSGWTSDHGSVYHDTGGNGPSSSTSYATFPHGTAAEALRNTAQIPVYPGAVVKAQCAVRGVGTPNGTCGVRISWRDSTDTEIGNIQGNTTTGNATNGTYVTGTAPAGAMFAHVECATAGRTDTTGYYTVDNFWAALLPDTMDQVPDSATRFAAAESGADKTAGKSLTVLTDRTLDNVADSATYLRTIQQSANAGAITIDNASFQLGNATGWTATNASAYAQSAAPAPAIGGQYIVVNATAANGFIATNRRYACNPGDKVSVGGLAYAASGTAIIYATFYTASGAFISSIGAGTAAAAWAPVSASGTVPSNAAYFTVVCMQTTPGDYALFNYVWCTINDVRVAGSGVTIGDQRNLNPITWAGVRSTQTVSPLAVSYDTAIPANLSFTCASVTFNGGGFAVSYSASSASTTQTRGTGPVTYYFYYRDATNGGGSKALNFTTNQDNLSTYTDINYLGLITIAIPAGSSGGSGVQTGAGAGAGSLPAR